MEKNKKHYPAWRKSLDIYRAWYSNHKTNSELAKMFKTDGKTVQRSIDTIGDMLYSTGRRQRTFSELEAMFVMVSRVAPENDVTKITRILISWFPTMEEFFGYHGTWDDIPGVGPKYKDILSKIQSGEKKEVHVRISYQAYLKLRKYCEIEKKTFSTAVEDFVNYTRIHVE